MIEKFPKKTYQNFKISDFPVNKEIAYFFKDLKKKCKKHDNFLEYFCMTCEIQICALCGLFGDHKDHKITTNKELVSINNSIINKMKETIDQEQIIFSDDNQKNDNFGDIVRNKVEYQLKKYKEKLLSDYNVK